MITAPASWLLADLRAEGFEPGSALLSEESVANLAGAGVALASVLLWFGMSPGFVSRRERDFDLARDKRHAARAGNFAHITTSLRLATVGLRFP